MKKTLALRAISRVQKCMHCMHVNMQVCVCACLGSLRCPLLDRIRTAELYVIALVLLIGNGDTFEPQFSALSTPPQCLSSFHVNIMEL